jgi:hypothetical protein
MHLFTLRVRTLLPIFAALLLAPPAFSQSAEELLKENESLRQQLADLQRKFEALERENANLRARLSSSAGGGTTAPDAPEPTIELKPENSPLGLYNAIVASHEEAMQDMEMGRANDRTRTAYMRTLERWSAAATRTFKVQIEWVVRIKDVEVNRMGATIATLVPVDPESEAELGEPFEVTLDSAVIRRLQPMMERGDVDRLVLAGVVSPIIRINERRAERGAFDNPKFIAPYAEYAYTVDVRSLTPLEKKQAKPAPARNDRRGDSRGERPAPTPSK